MKLSKNKIKELLNIDIEDEYGYIEVITDKQYKSKKQNRLFHALIDCFWESGCSSFESKQQLRWHYKWIAALIEIEYISPLNDWTKECLWKAIKLLPLDKEEMKSVVDLLRGKVLKEHSWGEASKHCAKLAIDELLKDMDCAGVINSKKGKKYEEILRSLGEWYDC